MKQNEAVKDAIDGYKKLGDQIEEANQKQLRAERPILQARSLTRLRHGRTASPTISKSETICA